MILAVVLAALLLSFLLVRHNVGIPFLAMIAGVAVYDSFGEGFATAINQWVPSISVVMAQEILYALFVAVFPLLLYFRAGKGGLFGVMRIIESVIFALMLTILVADTLSSFFYFDTLAQQITSWIDGIRGVIMVVGIIFSYVDVFFYRSGRLS